MIMDLRICCSIESRRFSALESHICQSRADMGHPAFVESRDYSVRSACMGSMYAALRAGISAAINPITESVTATAT